MTTQRQTPWRAVASNKRRAAQRLEDRAAALRLEADHCDVLADEQDADAGRLS